MEVVVERPTEQWSLERLGRFCRRKAKMIAVEAWGIGDAMVLAKTKCLETNVSFVAWQQEHGFSPATTSRYMRLYESYESPEMLEGIGLVEALEDVGIPTRARSGASSGDAETKVVVAENETGDSYFPRLSVRPLDEDVPGEAPVWAAEPKGDDDNVPEVVPMETGFKAFEILRAEISTGIPEAIVSLRTRIDWVRGHDVEVLAEVWPVEQTDLICRESIDLKKSLDDFLAVAPRARSAKGASA